VNLFDKSTSFSRFSLQKGRKMRDPGSEVDSPKAERGEEMKDRAKHEGEEGRGED